MTRNIFIPAAPETFLPADMVVGNTPMRKCRFLSYRYHTNVLVKEEFHNPGMSSKDRPALFMLKDAVRRGKIPPNGIFVEASSGNTGFSLAMFAKQMGYRSTIFVSRRTCAEKITLLKSVGADVEICENSNGFDDPHSTQFCAREYARNRSEAYFTDQYNNSENQHAHYSTTGPEIWEQTDGQVTHFIAGIGTGGTISGVGRYLKSKKKNIQIWGVEPKGSVLAAFLNTGTLPEKNNSFECIDGIGRNYIPRSFDPRFVDSIVQVGSTETNTMAHNYRRGAGILPGLSSAAVLAALDCYASRTQLDYQHTVVLLFPDHGSRYLSKLYPPEHPNPAI